MLRSPYGAHFVPPKPLLWGVRDVDLFVTLTPKGVKAKAPPGLAKQAKAKAPYLVKVKANDPLFSKTPRVTP